MEKQQDLIMVTVSVPDTTTAEDLAEALILRKLAAVVHLIPEVKTIRLKKDLTIFNPEILMLIKTLKKKELRLVEFLKINSPAGDKLDIISTVVHTANPVFSKWIKEEIEENEEEE